AGDVAYFGARKRRGVKLDRRIELVVEHEERCHFVHGSVSSVRAMFFIAQLKVTGTVYPATCSVSGAVCLSARTAACCIVPGEPTLGVSPAGVAQFLLTRSQVELVVFSNSTGLRYCSVECRRRGL